jgi:hypothetical protein
MAESYRSVALPRVPEGLRREMAREALLSIGVSADRADLDC